MRSRAIKGSPVRTAGGAWAVIETVIIETLAPAASIDEADVRAALDVLDGLGSMLVASGVLSDEPLVLRALPLQLEITVSLGDAALHGEERLGKVPGAATATEWGLFVPDPEPFTAEVRATVARHFALSAGKAPAEQELAEASGAGFAVDADALRRLSGDAR